MSLLLARARKNHLGSTPPGASPSFNPSDKAAGATLSESNKRVTRAAGLNQWAAARAVTGHAASDAGGFYFEVEVVDGSAIGVMVGIGTAAASIAAAAFPGSDANGFSYYGNGAKYNAGTSTAYSTTYTTGDVIGVLLKNGKLYFRKNGTWIGDPAAETGAAFVGLSGTFYPMHGVFTGGASSLRFITRTGSLPAGASDWS